MTRAAERRQNFPSGKQKPNLFGGNRLQQYVPLGQSLSLSHPLILQSLGSVTHWPVLRQQKGNSRVQSLLSLHSEKNTNMKDNFLLKKKE